MRTRGRSVPATALPNESSCRSSNNNAITTAIVPSSSYISSIALNNSIATCSDPKDLSNADVLARMTIELNMRAVGNQAERLEKDLSTLMMRAKEDKAFRERHEARLQNIFREILAVKQRMEEIQGPEWSGNGKVDLEECKKGMDESAELFRKEMGSSRACEIQTRSKTRKPFSEPKTARSQVSIKQRIDDAIGSTRRWNRDHKTTKLSDAIFIANYLRQQSKRDPPMAVYIQRSILRQVNRSGRQKAQARPKNLEQFCQTLVWRDVIETAENVLVRNTARTAKALEERMSFS
ncbi:hypothetical protein TrVFT333_007331 [Trichoderma virens FT-333]|nr:hypothetical protein TrVFT333_007331 [Trichoderma virens FT-333]